MPLDEMSPEARVCRERALKVRRTIAPQCAEVSARHGFAEEIERDLFRSVRRNREAATVHRDAIARAHLRPDARRSDLQLGAALSRANPEHGADFFDEAGEHDSSFCRRSGSSKDAEVC